MRQGGLPFCAGLAARTRPVSWPAAYALILECCPPERVQVRGGLKPLFFTSSALVGRWVEAWSQVKVVVVRKECVSSRVQKSRRAGLLYRVSSHEVSLRDYDYATVQVCYKVQKEAAEIIRDSRESWSIALWG
jgi:hypothetical protein